MEQQELQNYKDYIEQIDLQRYWLVLKRRWLPALAISLLPLAGAMYLASKSQDAYESIGQVLIKQRDPAAALAGVPPELTTQQDFGYRPGDEISVITTQQTILTSSEVLDDVITALNLKDEKGERLKINDLRKNLTTAQVPGTSIIQVSYKGKDPAITAAVVNALMDAYVNQNIESNRAEARGAREFIEKELPRARDTLEQASAGLSSFRTRNDIVSLEQEAAATVELLTALENEVRANRAQLATISSEADTLRAQLGFSPEEAKDLVKLSGAPSIREVLTSLGQVQTNIAIQGSSYTENHPVMTTLRRQEQALTSLLNSRAQDVIGRPFSSSVGNYEFSTVEATLTANLLQREAERSALEQSFQELESTRNEYINRSDTLPTLEREEIRLVNERDAAQKEYDLLAETLQQVKLAENQTVGTAQVQERAEVPDKPVSNQEALIKILFAGLLGGALTGIAVAFLLDLLDKSIKTVKDAQMLLGYRPLALIPQYKLPSAPALVSSSLPLKVNGIAPQLVTLTGASPAVSSAYQMLQANLKFIEGDRPLRQMVVSSSIQGEGKSEVCANLAVSLAQVGHQVLLIDADLRSPVQHYLWNVPNHTGLSHVLMGESRVESALQPIADNITLLSAGAHPPNPLAMMDSKEMKALLEQLSSSYDVILIDASPMAGAADAAILGKVSDGVILVLRPRYVDSASLLASKSLLGRSGTEVLGFVATHVDISNEHDDYLAFTGSQFEQPPEIPKSLSAKKDRQTFKPESMPLSR
jgi:capsular exopolysaccharide synthesis family protein